jgi:hypothetical protein
MEPEVTLRFLTHPELHNPGKKSNISIKPALILSSKPSPAFSLSLHGFQGKSCKHHSNVL